jgi:hypothetical protein
MGADGTLKVDFSKDSGILGEIFKDGHESGLAHIKHIQYGIGDPSNMEVVSTIKGGGEAFIPDPTEVTQRIVKQTLKISEDIKIDEFNIDETKKENENNILDLSNSGLEEENQTEKTIVENSLEELETFDIVEPELELEQEPEPEPKENDLSLDLEIEDLSEDIEENTHELKEVNNLEVSLENNLETMHLKKPNQVYFELYKEARNKAKLAKKNALLAYLEAKNIKKTYMLENLNDNSDSDIDAEIDDVSESELEGL